MLCPPFLLVKDSHRLNMAPSMPNSGFLLYFCTSRGIKANCKRIVPLAFQFMCFHSCRITAELLVHYVIISIWWYKSKCCIHNPICRWKRAVIPRLGYLLLHSKPSGCFRNLQGYSRLWAACPPLSPLGTAAGSSRGIRNVDVAVPDGK